MEQLLTGLGIDRSFFVVAALFWVAYFIIRNFFVIPVMRVLEERRRDIDDARSAWEGTTAEVEARIQEERVRLADARLEARSKREEIRGAALEHRSTVLGEAKAESDRLLSKARSELGATIDRETTALDARAHEIGQAASRRLLGERA